VRVETIDQGVDPHQRYPASASGVDVRATLRQEAQPDDLGPTDPASVDHPAARPISSAVVAVHDFRREPEIVHRTPPCRPVTASDTTGSMEGEQVGELVKKRVSEPRAVRYQDAA